MKSSTRKTRITIAISALALGVIATVAPAAASVIPSASPGHVMTTNDMDWPR